LKDIKKIIKIKRCEQCKSFLNCDIYIRVAERLLFLLDVLNINDPEDIAKDCRFQKPIPRSEQLTAFELRDFFGFI